MSASAAPANGKDGAKPKKSPLIMILLIVIVLLLVGGGGAGYYFWKHSKPAVVVVPPPVFFALAPFTVNLSAGSGDADDDGDTHYLHLGLTLKIPNAETEHQLTAYLPELRSRILLLLSSRKPSDLATVAGKDKLSEDIRASIEKLMAKDGKEAKVDSVLLTDFVIQ